MQKEFDMIEKEIQEINCFDNCFDQEDVVSFSELCGAYLTILCC